ncbi:MAG: biotin/lipoyl-containing protein [Candidatus Korobacteraceae bacterium]
MIYEVTLASKPPQAGKPPEAGKPLQVEVVRQGALWLCRMDGREWLVDVVEPRPDVLSLVIAGAVHEVRRDRFSEGMRLVLKGKTFLVDVRDPRSLRARRASAASGEGPQKLLASMPGKVVRVLKFANDHVEAGEGILVVEAMKMQNELKSPKKGIVRQVIASPGAAVNAGDVLAIVE